MKNNPDFGSPDTAPNNAHDPNITKKSSHPPGNLAKTSADDSLNPLPVATVAPVLDSWPPHLAGMTHEEIMGFDTICQHELAHGVMRWLLRLCATEIWATPEEGFCAGTGKPIAPDHALLITLAGYAFELGIFPWTVNWEETQGHDFDEARALLRHEWLRISVENNSIQILNVNEAMEMWLRKAADMLYYHIDFIQRAADSLMAKRKLSARSLAAMLRNYDRQLKRQGLDRMLHLRRRDPDERQCG